MIERILKEKLHLSDKQIEDLNTLIYFDGYEVSDEMSVDGNSVVLVSRFAETHNDSIVRITYEPISQNILVRMRSFVYGKDEEAGGPAAADAGHEPGGISPGGGQHGGHRL